jgi:hypothetical protein
MVVMPGASPLKSKSPTKNTNLPSRRATVLRKSRQLEKQQADEEEELIEEFMGDDSKKPRTQTP